jgi:hypothetical protein
MGLIPDVIGFFNWPNPPSLTTGLELTQPLAEISTKNLSGSEGQPAFRAHNFSTLCELI